MSYANFKVDHRRRRHRPRHLGCAGPLDERDLAGEAIEELAALVEQLAADAAVKGVVITSGKDTFCAGADLTLLESLGRIFADAPRRQRGTGGDAPVRGKPQAVAALSPHRDLRQAVGRGDQRHRARRRLRACARLPPPRRRAESADPPRAAGNQGRPVSRAPAARRASRACWRPPTRCSSCSRATSIKVERAKAMKLIDAIVPPADLVKAAKDWIKAGGKAEESMGHRRLQAAGRAGLLQGRHDDLPGRQRDLPARDLRQLSGRAGDPAGRLRGPAIAVRPRAAGGIALVRKDPALARSRGDDALAVRVDAGAQQGRAPARPAAHHASKRVGIIGAGFMGASVGYVTALAGIDVVLIDRDQESADRGKAHSAKLIGNQINRGRATAADRDALLARITATADYAALADCDLVIEAVFEDRKVKAETYAKAQACSATRRDLRLQHLDPADHLARQELRRSRALHRHPFLLAGRADDAGRDHPRQGDRRRGAGDRARLSCARSARPRSSSTIRAASTPRAWSAPICARAI